ncbi:D-aminopeptidase [Shinella sp. 838]|jgi:D-aminopeptidase|uniref:D-aminopeptidase n=1 Tax=unclassified Shinella TaxID=2643062 RepID=UPI0003C54DC3|nr:MULTISPECIES: D-aminopeptidase [unclassified Shinella]EYR79243.1 D-aminopeptidase Dap [Shinella sp. DD12]MDG4672558.1 D-aminopeptidase [Shinella sp. 838]
MIDEKRLEAEMDALAVRFPGPGGVAGVVSEGRIVALRSWGFSELDARRSMTAGTRLPICSVSKQFTCAAMLAACGTPEALDGRLAAHLPNFDGPLPRVRDLCNNQSGLRDYWALTVLHGARAEQAFSRDDAASAFKRMRSGHFAPGTRYSYSNGNFRLLSDLLEEFSSDTLETLYARHIWEPAGMAGAVLTADTRQPEDGVVGYEGSDATGYLPADNGIYWRGDAGISASLDDMLAYERWIDATRGDPDSLYRKIAVPQTFRDGAAASYGFGLQHSRVGDVAFTGHSGALRGFRAFRAYSAEARLSVVVMFNHHGDAHGAAHRLLRAAFDLPHPASKPLGERWGGQWMSRETGLLARLEPGFDSATLRFGTSPESLLEAEEGSLASSSVKVARAGEDLLMQRAQENYAERLVPVASAPAVGDARLAGRYRSPELEADIVIECRDGGTYLWAEGFLGTGRPEIVRPAGPDVWLVVTRRSMDAPAPGDWTLVAERDAAGDITGLVLGCWLARGIRYVRCN